MDLTPIVPAGRQVIERYAAAGFRVSGVVYNGAILVFPERTIAWAPASVAAITTESLAPVLAHGGVQILLLGCGRRFGAIAPALRSALKAAGIVIEPMDTGAACRTYNVLLAEDRRVAAALLPPV
ncbi:MAG: Mth938-like domain-containing protein [Alphaproteobacteria bacterium]|nr:Mth938-like domain-containing protein [Alphaproteobacteria bacterium]MBV9861835.1 Mth938-like domain-containing protein [Alphaproteobacteria bacterium]